MHVRFQKLLMKLVHGRAAIFYAKQQDSIIKLIVTGLTAEE